MGCERCGKTVPTTPSGMRRRFCSRRCQQLATWPCIPAPSSYQPRYSSFDEAWRVPVRLWPAVVPVPVERLCVDCGAPLPEPTRPGRPRVRCERCRAGQPVPDWQRPAREPDDSREPDWVGELLEPPGMSWQELQARRR